MAASRRSRGKHMTSSVCEKPECSKIIPAHCFKNGHACYTNDKAYCCRSCRNDDVRRRASEQKAGGTVPRKCAG